MGSQLTVFNPHNLSLDSLPSIMIFSAVVDGKEGPAYALSEDGKCLGSHYCSNESFVPLDLGGFEGRRPDREEAYKSHYPNGYKIEFILAKFVESHEKLNKAFELNKNLPEAK